MACDLATVLELKSASLPSPRAGGAPLSEPITWAARFQELWLIESAASPLRRQFILTATGVLHPAEGAVFLFGRDHRARSGDAGLPERLRTGAVLGDDGGLLPDLSLRDNVALPLRYHQPSAEKDLEKRVDALLSHMEIAEFAAEPAQDAPRYIALRAALARALTLRPELLLIESPWSGLTEEDHDWWRDTLIEIHRGRALLERPPTMVVLSERFPPFHNVSARKAALAKKGLMDSRPPRKMAQTR